MRYTRFLSFHLKRYSSKCFSWNDEAGQSEKDESEHLMKITVMVNTFKANVV